MTALHVIATEWLREHPEYHIHGAKALAQMVDDPKLTRSVWRKARKALHLPDAPRKVARVHSYPSKRKPRVLADNSVRIEINVETNVASVTINGQTSTRVLRQRDMVVEAYKRDGFKYQWLNNNTILLTKRKRKAA